MTSSGDMFCSFTISESRPCSAFSCSRLDANCDKQISYAQHTIDDPLTLLHDVCLEIYDMADERFLSPFPATDALLKLLAVPLEEFVVSE